MPKLMRYLWLLLLLPLVAHAEAVKPIEGISSADSSNLVKQEKNITVSKKYKAGKHYRVLKTPAQTDTKADQIEVAEVFWYGCPHCYTLEGIVDAWKPSLSKDVNFIRVPAFYGPNIWKSHAQLYYTLQSMGVIEKVHDAIFDEVQNKKNYLKNTDAMAAFLNKNFGIEKAKFENSYNAIGIVHQLLKASSMVRGYGLTGVPAIVIDGRYVVEPRLAGSLENMTAISDFLISKIREERKKEQEKAGKKSQGSKSLPGKVMPVKPEAQHQVAPAA